MKKVSELFHVYSGSKLDFGKLTPDDNGLNFVSRNSNYNGVVGKIQPEDGMKVYKKGDITVTLGGSYLLSCFVQDEDFVTAQNVAVLRPFDTTLTDNEKWFYCYALRENRFKFSAFGREVNKYLDDILLPEKIPSWVYSISNKKITTNNISSTNIIDFTSWEYFPLTGVGGLFDIENCKCKNASDLLDGDDIEYIGARKSDLGVMNSVAFNDDLTTKGNCIIFICDGQGSVGFSNYIDHDFIGSTTLSVGRNINLNKYNALFIVAILDKERYRYSFGRKYRTNIPKSKILLPYKIVNNTKTPDWEYMESYIKSLPFGDKL